MHQFCLLPRHFPSRALRRDLSGTAQL